MNDPLFSHTDLCDKRLFSHTKCDIGGTPLGQRTWRSPVHSLLDEWDSLHPPHLCYLPSSSPHKGTRARDHELLQPQIKIFVCVCVGAENSKLDRELHEWREGERNRIEQRQRDRVDI